AATPPGAPPPPIHAVSAHLPMASSSCPSALDVGVAFRCPLPVILNRVLCDTTQGKGETRKVVWTRSPGRRPRREGRTFPKGEAFPSCKGAFTFRARGEFAPLPGWVRWLPDVHGLVDPRARAGSAPLGRFGVASIGRCLQLCTGCTPTSLSGPPAADSCPRNRTPGTTSEPLCFPDVCV